MVATQVAYVQVGSVVVGTDFAVAVDHDVAESGESAAPVIHEYSVFPVADHPDFGNIGNSIIVASIAFGLLFAVLVALVLGHLEVYVGLHLGLLFEQGLHRPHSRFLHLSVCLAHHRSSGQ